MTKPGMQIHPIRSKDDHRQAVARIEALMSAAPNTPEGDELDVLATLVDAYEAKHFVMDAPSPVAAILFRMEQEQLSRKDLEPLIGSRARVSEILTGKRSLTLDMVRRVRGGLGISADLLIAPLPTKSAPRSVPRLRRNLAESNSKSPRRLSHANEIARSEADLDEIPVTELVPQRPSDTANSDTANKDSPLRP